MLADWLAGEDVEGVPVLRAAEGVPVSFGLLQAEDVEAVEQHLDLVPGVEGHVGVIGPAVTDTEQLAGEDPAGGKRPADPRPQGRELLRRTERQAETGMDRSLPSGQSEAGPWGWGWRRSHGQTVRRGGRAVMWPPLTLPDTWIRRMMGTSGPRCARTFR